MAPPEYANRVDDYYRHPDDDSTFNRSRYQKREDRYRSSSADAQSHPRSGRRHSSYKQSRTSTSDRDGGNGSGVAKVVLGVVFVEVVAACLSVWMRKKSEEREHDQRRQRRRQFEKAKAKRRREEERWEREEEDRERRNAERWADVEVHEVRRIGYGLPEQRARSESRAPRRVESPLEEDEDRGDQYWDDERQHSYHHSRSRSRPAR